MTFQEILSDIRKKAFTERDKGFRFEKLMRAYLLTDPLYATTLKTVWLWSDFPFRKDFSGKDTGIEYGFDKQHEKSAFCVPSRAEAQCSKSIRPE